MAITVRSLLEEATPTREMVDRFLSGTVSGRVAGAAFDGELGYVLRSNVARDGYDDCYTISHYMPSGERKVINYADRPCRINTYGDSFTQCHHVSDGETWQEILAAHLGEPIRNFGVGGYGFYQAYRRMLRVEKTDRAAPYIILNIFGDDHVRSVYSWRWVHMRGARLGASRFCRNPWPYLRLDLQTGEFEELANPYPTPESLYRLCDKEYVYETFRDRFDIQAYLATQYATDVDVEMLRQAGDVLGVPTDLADPDATASTGQRLLMACALRSSEYVLRKAATFAQRQGKRLVILLSYGQSRLREACEGRTRFDQSLLAFLQENGFLYVDSLAKHLEDYACYRGSAEDYVRRFYVQGHYNPMGNLFFAFAVRGEIIDWLDPKPPCYREQGPEL